LRYPYLYVKCKDKRNPNILKDVPALTANIVAAAEQPLAELTFSTRVVYGIN
jgi:hypothetical protein